MCWLLCLLWPHPLGRHDSRTLVDSRTPPPTCTTCTGEGSTYFAHVKQNPQHFPALPLLFAIAGEFGTICIYYYIIVLNRLVWSSKRYCSPLADANPFYKTRPATGPTLNRNYKGWRWSEAWARVAIILVRACVRVRFVLWRSVLVVSM